METVKQEKTTGEALVIKNVLKDQYANGPQCVMVMAGESVCFNFSLSLREGLKFTLDQWNEIVQFVESQLDAVGDKASWDFDWSRVPGEYLYLACDEDGAAYFYEHKPYVDDINHGEWTYDDGWVLFAGLNIIPKSIDWDKSLIRRPMPF